MKKALGTLVVLLATATASTASAQSAIVEAGRALKIAAGSRMLEIGASSGAVTSYCGAVDDAHLAWMRAITDYVEGESQIAQLVRIYGGPEYRNYLEVNHAETADLAAAVLADAKDAGWLPKDAAFPKGTRQEVMTIPIDEGDLYWGGVRSYEPGKPDVSVGPFVEMQWQGSFAKTGLFGPDGNPIGYWVGHTDYNGQGVIQVVRFNELGKPTANYRYLDEHTGETGRRLSGGDWHSQWMLQRLIYGQWRPKP